MSIGLEEYTPEYWSALEVGQTVYLSDKQGVENALSKKEGTESQYVIKSIRDIQSRENGIQWLFFELESEENIWLLVKIVGDEFDLRVYFEPKDFAKGDRSDMIENECFWLFEEPENTEDFAFNELEFTKNFQLEESEYQMKPFGMLTGIVQDTPSNALNGSLVCITEYRTEDEVDNPEIMFIEIGGETSDTGGFIYVLVGTPITAEEIEII